MSTSAQWGAAGFVFYLAPRLCWSMGTGKFNCYRGSWFDFFKFASAEFLICCICARAYILLWGIHGSLHVEFRHCH